MISMNSDSLRLCFCSFVLSFYLFDLLHHQLTSAQSCVSAYFVFVITLDLFLVKSSCDFLFLLFIIYLTLDLKTDDELIRCR